MAPLRRGPPAEPRGLSLPRPHLHPHPGHGPVKAWPEARQQLRGVETDPARPGGAVRQDHHCVIALDRPGDVGAEALGQQRADPGVELAGLAGPFDQLGQVPACQQVLEQLGFPVVYVISLT